MTAVGAIALFAGAAVAGTPHLQIKGTHDKLYAGDMSSIIFHNSSTPPGNNSFTGSELDAVAGALEADGISLEGKITVFYALITDGINAGGPTSYGIQTIVDRNNLIAGSPTANAKISAATEITNLNTLAYINDDPTTGGTPNQFNDLSEPYVNNGSAGEFFAPGTAKRSAGTFWWDDVNRGDGQAWTNTRHGDRAWYDWDSVSGFNPHTPGSGGDISDFFQFLTWDGSSWQVVATRNFVWDGSIHNQTYILDVIIPLPGPAAMGLAGLMGLGVIRRRAR